MVSTLLLKNLLQRVRMLSSLDWGNPSRYGPEEKAIGERDTHSPLPEVTHCCATVETLLRTRATCAISAEVASPTAIVTSLVRRKATRPTTCASALRAIPVFLENQQSCD